jgi:hypothetical protein
MLLALRTHLNAGDVIIYSQEKVFHCENDANLGQIAQLISTSHRLNWRLKPYI